VFRPSVSLKKHQTQGSMDKMDPSNSTGPAQRTTNHEPTLKHRRHSVRFTMSVLGRSKCSGSHSGWLYPRNNTKFIDCYGCTSTDLQFEIISFYTIRIYFILYC
jgi:hypothetical protein